MILPRDSQDIYFVNKKCATVSLMQAVSDRVAQNHQVNLVKV